AWWQAEPAADPPRGGRLLRVVEGARSDMKRREFITLLGGAVAWPLPASAQLPTIGFLSPVTASVENQRVAAFVQRLRAAGWIEGHSVAIKVRWADGRSERAAEIVAEFVQQKVDVLVSRGTVSVLAAKQAKPVIPIVFAGGDPVGTGFVVMSGNVTCLSFQQTDLAGKRLELLREVVHALRQLAILAIANLSPVCICVTLRQRPARSALRWSRWKFGVWRISLPVFEEVKAGADMFRPIRWRSAVPGVRSARAGCSLLGQHARSVVSFPLRTSHGRGV